MKKVLIIDINNSTSSIIAEALINKYLNSLKAYSVGIYPTQEINSYTIKVLKRENAWREDYHPKGFDEILDIEFDLVIIISDIEDNIKEKFPKKVEVISVIFDEPNKDNFERFMEVTKEIKEKLLPIVRKKLS
ncbi:MAG: arsenate reductase ArsC [Epsilonproteobacteria bacterium]|nr:arsenate reductase ArsC [Campylobacterota bacterium]